jgi:cellulose synthase (UDP-forming)
MPTTSPQTRATGASTRQAWRPLQRSTRVAIIGALLATLFYQAFLLDPQYRGPIWLWSAMLLAEGLTAIHAIGTWWTILAHDNRDEPVDVTVWRRRRGAEHRRPHHRVR